MGGSKTQCASAQQDKNNLNLNKSAAFAPSMVNVRNVHQVKRYQNMSNYNLKMLADYNDSAPCDSNHDSAFQQDATMDPAFARKTMELYQIANLKPQNHREQVVNLQQVKHKCPEGPQDLFYSRGSKQNHDQVLD